MAIHSDTASMLQESLREYVHVAEYCVRFRKLGAEWGAKQEGGCLGYPAALLMFSIADTIGSFHKAKDGFEVAVDGVQMPITKDAHHFRILNSEYYELGLSAEAIGDLYKKYRNLLVHNASLPPDHFLFLAEETTAPFPVVEDRVHVNVAAFLRVTKVATGRFLDRVEELVPASHQEGIIQSKG